MQQLETLLLNVRVEPFFDEHPHFPGARIGNTNVDPVKIAAAASEVELVRVVGEPQAAPRFVARGIDELPRAGNRERLVLESIRLYLEHLSRFAIVDEKLGLSDVLFPGHIVFVGFQLGPFVAHRVNDPQFTRFPLITANKREPLRVFRPEDPHALPLILVLRPFNVSVTSFENRVAVVLLAVGGELNFVHGNGILRSFSGFAVFSSARVENASVILAAHRVQVVISGEDHRQPIGRNTRPTRVIVRRLPILQFPELLCGHIVFEVKHLLLKTRSFPAFPLLLPLLFLLVLFHFAFLIVLRGFDLEPERVLVQKLDFANGKVLCVPRISRNSRQFGSDSVPVENLPLRAGSRVDDEEEFPVGGLPFVPEPLTSLDPLRFHRRAVYQLVDLVRRKPSGETVVDTVIRYRGYRACLRT